MLNSLGLDSIATMLEDLFNIDKYINAGATFLTNLEILEQLVLGLVAIIIIFLGTFELIKKLSKIFVVIAVLVGLYLLYQGGTFDSLIG